MKYEVLIYAGSEVLIALDVDGDKMQYISMDGNQSHPADDANGFYENILDYFNVDDLSELKAGVRIINGGTSKKNIEFFNKKFIKVDDFSLWRTEELLPITVLQKSMIERNSIIKVAVYDRCYKIAADSTFNISVEDADIADKVMTLEDFTLMNNFNGSNFHSNTDEVKDLTVRLYEAEHVIKELERKYRESEQNVFMIREDVANLNKKVLDLVEAEKYEIGNIIEFGKNNGEPISWIILERKCKTLLLVSKDIIENKAYSISKYWECSIEEWLNNDFYNNIFNDEEKERIVCYFNKKIFLIPSYNILQLFSKDIRKVGTSWWTRIGETGSTNYDRIIDANGEEATAQKNELHGVRPLLYIKL